MKQDFSLRPIYHQKEERIEVHIFVSFVVYCLHVTLKQRLKSLTPGLTTKSVFEKFKEIKMVDVHLPLTDGRTMIMPRYTYPEKDHQTILRQL